MYFGIKGNTSTESHRAMGSISGKTEASTKATSNTECDTDMESGRIRKKSIKDTTGWTRSKD